MTQAVGAAGDRAKLTKDSQAALNSLYAKVVGAKALGANPLLRSRLTTAAGPETEVETLRSLLRDACESLRSHHRDEKLYQVLRRTFLEPAPSQERAAEALELPFSTYRYQLGQGVERVTRWLWAREIDAGAHL